MYPLERISSQSHNNTNETMRMPATEQQQKRLFPGYTEE
jgi:hypothetical protein